MRRLLVTGGAGFIGSHFVEHALSRSLADKIVVLDALTYAGKRSNLESALADSRVRFVHGDICDGALVEALLREEGLDGIVNFAAESSVDRSIDDPAVFHRSNVQGVLCLLEASRWIWCTGSGRRHRFHQISTDEVFGAVPDGAGLRNESAPYAPRSPYAATKASADHLIWAWRNTYGLQASISYSSNVYGPRQQREKFIPAAISKLLEGGKVPVYGDGRQRRSWIFVRDICRALELFMAGDTEGQRLYLGSEMEFSNLEVLGSLATIAGADAGDSMEFVEDRPGHDRRYGLSSDVFRKLSGFKEQVAWKQGLVETFNWYQEQDPGSPSGG